MSKNLINLSWVNVDSILIDAIYRYPSIKEPQFPITRILGVARGGISIAAMLCYKLKVRKLYSIQVASYDDNNKQSPLTSIVSAPVDDLNSRETLIVDDIVDTGNTMRMIGWMYPNAKRFALCCKPEMIHLVDYCGFLVDKDSWVNFPWESELPEKPV